LTVNRRQVEAWEQRAIEDVRAGNLEQAIAAYAEHDRIRAFEDRDDRDRALVSDWWQAHQAGEAPVVYAHRRAQVDRLNTICQRLRAEHGQLGLERLAVGDRTFAVGDRVVLGANALDRLGVANGTSAEITALDVPGRTMTIRILEEEPPRTVTLPGWYLDAVVRPGQSRRVDLAYAHTDMRSQGRTEQRALLALDGKEDMQGSYVQPTRGKERTDMYLTMGPEPLGDHDGHPRGEPVEPARLLGRVLTRDGSKTMATDTPVLAEVRRWSTSRLREERDQLAALGRECRPDRSRELAWRHRVDAHAQEPARRLGTGWDRLEPTLPPAPAQRSPDPSGPAGVGWPAPVLADPARTPRGGYGTPGRSALATYRRERARELAAWARTLPWRAAAVLAVAVGAAIVAAAAGLHRAALLGGLAAGLVVGWRLRFRVSRDTRAWWDGARGERATARLLRRLERYSYAVFHRHSYVVFHDVAIPGTPANTGRWWISDQD
jgi:hypothetical protein